MKYEEKSKKDIHCKYFKGLHDDDSDLHEVGAVKGASFFDDNPPVEEEQAGTTYEEGEEGAAQADVEDCMADWGGEQFVEKGQVGKNDRQGGDEGEHGHQHSCHSTDPADFLKVIFIAQAICPAKQNYALKGAGKAIKHKSVLKSVKSG